jgi:tRNA pseudouridine13 synthase
MLIKSIPEDFIVEEIPIDFSGKGDYAIYRLTKKNYNTESAVQIICRNFHIDRNNIKYAGTKDKNAITSQYISIYKNKNLSMDGDLKLEFVTFHNDPLSLGFLKGNKFKITIREIEKQEIKSPAFVPNYFDEQRFSTNNFEIGLSILKKDFGKAASLIDNLKVKEHLATSPNDFVGALKKLPQKILSIYIHSVQSFVFNEALFRMLKEYDGKTIDYSLGKMIFTDFHDESKLPLVGFDTLPKGDVKNILSELGLKTSDFIIRSMPELSVEESFRDCFVSVSDFSHEWLEDNIFTVNFSLPKGSYATIVLKSLIK